MLQRMKKNVLSCSLAVVALALFSVGAFASEAPTLNLSNSDVKGNLGELKNDAGSVYYLKTMENKTGSVLLPLHLSGSGFISRDSIINISISPDQGVIRRVRPGFKAVSVDEDGTWSRDITVIWTPGNENWKETEFLVTASSDSLMSASKGLIIKPVSVDLTFAATPDMSFLSRDVKGTSHDLSVLAAGGGKKYAFDELRLVRISGDAGFGVGNRNDPWGDSPSGLFATIGSTDITFTVSGDPVLKPWTDFQVKAGGDIRVDDDFGALVAGTRNGGTFGTFGSAILAKKETPARLDPSSITGYTGLPMNETILVVPPAGETVSGIHSVSPVTWNGLTATISSDVASRTAAKLILTGTPVNAESRIFTLQINYARPTESSGTNRPTQLSLPVTIKTMEMKDLVSPAASDWTGTVNGNSFTMTTDLLFSPAAQKALNSLLTTTANSATFVTPPAVASSTVDVSEDNKTVTINGTIAEGHVASDVVLKSLTLTLDGTVYTQDDLNVGLSDVSQPDKGSEGDDGGSGCNATGTGLLFSVLPLFLIVTRYRRS